MFDSFEQHFKCVNHTIATITNHHLIHFWLRFNWLIMPPAGWQHNALMTSLSVHVHVPKSILKGQRGSKLTKCRMETHDTADP